MKSNRFITMALVSTLVLGGASLRAGAANPDQRALRAEAQAELAAVTIDVDQADIAYSPVEDGVGSNFDQVVQYQEECLAGRQSFDDGDYADALKHLRKAD